MSETKTFVVPDNLTGNNDNLATMAMMNGGFGYIGWLLLIFALILKIKNK